MNMGTYMGWTIGPRLLYQIYSEPKYNNNHYTQKTLTNKKPSFVVIVIAEPATIERGRTLSRISLAKGANFRGRKSNSLMNLCGKVLLQLILYPSDTNTNRLEFRVWLRFRVPFYALTKHDTSLFPAKKQEDWLIFLNNI